MSSQNTLSGSYIGATSLIAKTDPFTLLHGTTQQLYVNTDEYNYKTTIVANLGYQGQTQFQVSLLGQYVYAYTTDCVKPGGAT